MTAYRSLNEQNSPPSRGSFLQDVVKGLSQPKKALPSRYFYDAIGSELFEKITSLPEYYPARVETALLRAHAADMVAGFGERGLLVEFGSGSSTKTEFLLQTLPDCAAYAPIDVSCEALRGARARLAVRFPKLQVSPVVADFSMLRRLPSHIGERSKTGFFPGSTIGNFTPAEAFRLLQRFRVLLQPRGHLLIGVDLQKDRGVLERAYNDSQGVTAAFNLNLLARINREISPVVDLEAFVHQAHYNEREGRIEMHLVSTRDQSFRIGDFLISLKAGETIHTENSYKYTVAQFQGLARCAGWIPGRTWLDREKHFSVMELRSPAPAMDA
jgi:dimethylhistidine N-methyltransferase